MQPGTKYLFLIILAATLMATGCAGSKKLTVGSTALLLEDVVTASNRQSDLKMVREGMPAYLMLLDGMVTAWPSNARLSIAAGQGYASYASAFAEDEDPEYARVLYGKAKIYALKALQLKGFADPQTATFDDFEAELKSRGKSDVPYLFWAAASWGNWIGLNQSSMAAMAELPKVEMLMHRALELDEGFYYGGPHIFMGILYASRPAIAGGDLDLAKEHFLKAIDLGNEKFLMARVYYAFHYARRAFDRDLFVETLKQVIDTPVDIELDLTLINSAAHAKARDMLNRVDELF
jgi:TRAP transporter T-component